MKAIIFLISFLFVAFVSSAQTFVSHFNTNSAEISSVENSILNLLNANENFTVVISGHTDSKGSQEFNQALSERRVNSAKSFLVSKGVAENRICVESFGEIAPIASNDTEEGRASNRRVEFKINRNIVETSSVSSSSSSVSADFSKGRIDFVELESNHKIDYVQIIPDTMELTWIEDNTLKSQYDSIHNTFSNSKNLVIVEEVVDTKQLKELKKHFKDSIKVVRNTKKMNLRSEIDSLRLLSKSAKKSGDLALSKWYKAQLLMAQAKKFDNDWDPTGFYDYWDYVPCYPNISTVDLNIHRVANYVWTGSYVTEYAFRAVKQSIAGSLRARARFVALQALEEGSWSAYKGVVSGHFGGSSLLKRAREARIRNLCLKNKPVQEAYVSE